MSKSIRQRKGVLLIVSLFIFSNPDSDIISNYLWECLTKIETLKVLVVDNYDSFTYNLVDCLRSLSVRDFEVVKNDQLAWDQVDRFNKILISPGPGTPKEAGDLMELLRRFYQTKSILGICLGHQALAQLLGARLSNLSQPRHGQSVSITIDNDDKIFKGLPKQITGGLYHSWSVESASLPKELQIIASSEGRVMGVRHSNFDLVGLQFHPESHATNHGNDILANWLAPGKA